MTFKHRCVEARWNEETSKWHVKVQNLDTQEIVEDVADVFITGSGPLNQWKWPDVPGLHDFKGTLLHSANWDEDFDPKVSRNLSPFSLESNNLPLGNRERT